MENWHLLLVILVFIVGILLIVKGGDFFVDSASWIAEISGIPKLIVGATVVSFATTLPELMVSSFAAAKGSVDMAAGNAIGSVIANVALIMGLSLVFMPTKVNRKDYLYKGIMMLLPLVIMFAFGFNGKNDGKLNFVASGLLILIFAANMAENVIMAKKTIKEGKINSTVQQNGEAAIVEEKAKPKTDKRTIIVNIVKFVLGTAGIVGGAQLLVNSATELAHRANIPEGIIGLTIVAVGTSLPELVTAITAIIKKESSLSVGNIIGANILNTCLIMPICTFICGKALPVSFRLISFDVPVAFFVGCLALVPMYIKGKFSRWQGVALLVSYVAYLVCLTVFFI